MRPSRRDVFAITGKAVATGGAVWLADAPGAGRRTVTVSEGTGISATASPDGKWIAFDLYTAIWLVPSRGGKARRLTGDLQDASRPHFSPDSRRLVFQSYREGSYHVYLMDLDRGRQKKITHGPHDHREPRFSPDGRTIAMASDRGGGGYALWLYDLETRRLSAVPGGEGEAGMPSWSLDGAEVVHTRGGTSVHAVSLDGKIRELVPGEEDATVYSPVFAGDGKTLAYVRAHADTLSLMVGDEAVSDEEDLFAGALTWISARRLLYTADGRLRTRDVATGTVKDVGFTATVPYQRPKRRGPVRHPDDTIVHPVRGIAGPVVSPDGGRVAFRALGAIWVLPIGGKPRAVVDDGYFASDPDWHPDGNSLVYSSDRDGVPALWRHDLGDGGDVRLGQVDGAQTTPRWSPDGTRIAYQDQDGATWVYDVAADSTRMVIPALFQPGRPTWSPEGNVLAIAAVRPRSARYREGTSQILTVDLTSGELAYHQPAPYRSISTRGDDGPVWSPDGTRLAFVMESVLWTIPVDRSGRPTGEPTRITDEPTDAPSWSGNSRSLLYLSNGRLRRISAAGGGPETIAVPLSWRRDRPRGRFVIQAGALWDGRADGLRRDVDIIVEGNRITGIEDRADRTGEKIVDATELTAMPGLIDGHVHWHLRGRHWGARQGPLWLAYGITTVRSPGDPVYQMLETRESLDAGKIVGPRYLATGEAIDGSRVYYNFMRPTLGPGQLRLEAARALELEYDLVKTYVRLPNDLQRAAIKRAHAAGVPLSSHYLYPAVRFGMDGMEHTGATNRLGYSQTMSLLGRSYGDATALFAKSGMSITPTLFTALALYVNDRSLVDDERTRVLFPEWEYRALENKVDLAGSGSPIALWYAEALKGNVAMLLKIHRNGGKIIGGSDAPLDQIAVAMHQNLRAMVHYGFTPREALMISSGAVAEWLGLDDELGTVEVGKLADLAIVDGDPLTDITHAAAVRMVVSNGRVHTVEDLMKAFSGPPRPRKAGTRVQAPLVSPTDDHWWHGESERESTHRC